MNKYILSIDAGTTSCRAILFDNKGKTIASGQKEFTQYFPQPGWVEHDANEIWETQLFCIKDCLKKSGISANDIAAIGITNQRETTVVWDRTTGKPIYNAIVWQCRRTQDLATELKTESNLFRETTGLVPDAYFSGPKIKWILDNVAGAKALANAGKLAFGTIDTWLIWNLTGGNHLTEPSNASRTLLFSLKSLDWDERLLQRLDIPHSILPKIIPSNGNFGTTKKDIVGFEVPILANLGDQQAAMFGQACFEKGMAKCTYGTGSFLLVNIGHAPHIVPGLLTTVAWQLHGEATTYALEGAIFIAGAAIQWLRDGLAIIESSAETEAMVKSIASNEGVYFVPALVGLGSPWWDSDVRGTICGLTRGSTRAHIVRAALESMPYQVKDVAETMAKEGINVSELRVDGGAAKNNFMLQFQTDLLKIQVLRAKQLESTAWGVAALAGIESGVIHNLNAFANEWQYDLKLLPKENRESDYAGWQNALRAAFACAGKSNAITDKAPAKIT
jgi:glycerol kinase